MAKTTTASSFETKIQAMIKGLSVNVPPTLRNILVAGQSMTVAQVLSRFEQIESMLTNIAHEREVLKASLAARKAEMPQDHAFYTSVVTGLKAQFGSNQVQLAAFGIQPPKARTASTTAAKAIAAAKAKATRALRGTKGKKQRQQLTLAGQATVQVLGPDGQPLIPSSDPASGSGSGSAQAAPVTPAPVGVAPPTPGH